MNKTTLNPGTAKVLCMRCKRPTEHAILADHSETGETEHIDWYKESHQVIQCKGCQNVCFREIFASSEDTDPDGRPSDQEKVFPNPERRSPIVDLWTLPKSIRDLYTETLICLEANAKTLACAGLRSVVEAICLNQGCTKPNLKSKIDELVSKGVLLKRDADYLHQHRFLGNEAVHELQAPPTKEFQIALKILEHLLESVYIVLDMAADLVLLRKTRGAKTA